ncbi:hypothetical protein D7Y13_03250 [Corallococcus praedator]|uniref:Uncharacterized protein n=1 Tax=Corallococcus praedator TaxID=2316724 RepID=A0ABX9QPY1_9BACT|nr:MULTISPECIES: hypothetical protein [Corallococcus]RKH34771.1 hypothetical protein D7X75_06825 [Corallococcus sp. CA031C]RKI15964.1 hypothetical protein D7Y13_03250 [Corallococcus praedator]
MLLAGFVVLAGCASTRPVKARAVVDCIITKLGRAENCQARKWDAALSPEQVRELIGHIQSREYKPVTYNGKPLDVPYTFHFEFRDPMPPADGGRLFPADAGTPSPES